MVARECIDVEMNATPWNETVMGEGLSWCELASLPVTELSWSLLMATSMQPDIVMKSLQLFFYRLSNVTAPASFFNKTTPDPTHIVQQYLQKQQVDVLPWPANSPDLSPIEYVWDEMKQQRLWNSRDISPEYETTSHSNSMLMLLASMRRRSTAVVDADGGHTRYWVCDICVWPLVSLTHQGTKCILHTVMKFPVLITHWLFCDLMNFSEIKSL